jgi:hypothetical protein
MLASCDTRREQRTREQAGARMATPRARRSASQGEVRERMGRRPLASVRGYDEGRPPGS